MPLQPTSGAGAIELDRKDRGRRSRLSGITVRRLDTCLHDVMDQAADINKAEKFRRTGLYIGPLLLGSIAGHSLYRVVCEGSSFTLISGSLETLVWNVPLFVGSAYVAWWLREPVGRFAFVALGLRQALVIWAAVRSPANRMLIACLGVAFGVLFTISGSLCHRPRRIVTASALFVAMFLFAWITGGYGERLIGRDSVFRPQWICLLQRNNLAV